MATNGVSNGTTNGTTTTTTTTTTTDGASSPSTDLLPKIIPHLDRHLVFPILEFIGEQEDQDPTEVLQLKYELLRETNMSDYVSDLEMQLNNQSTRSTASIQKREEVLQRKQLLEEETAKITSLLEDPEVTNNLRSDKVANLNYLKETHGVTLEEVTLLYDYGHFLYSIGDYSAASDTLFSFRLLSTDNERISAASWGKLACEILQANYETAMEEIAKMRDTIDTRLFNAPLAQLHQRTWLLHWSLFPMFYNEPARDTLVDLFFTPTYINTIQTSCPWLLRYLAAIVISGRGRTPPTVTGPGRNQGAGSYQKQIKDLVRIVRQEDYEYRDPVTEFIRALYVDFDFEEAQRKLRTAEEVLTTDFFLFRYAEPFVEAARHLISESYCKIHQRIDIADLSTRLNLTPSDGEKWIVNLIRDTRVDAKIDYKEGTVVMNHPPQSVYQQVIERTKGGFFRTQVLSAAVGK
ncbi:MAG: eukaryotic translation initiation factor 3 subunit E [Chrysothrix sp. TS-e1954]|nr:MAG: eukaryotic translation initiation factor 3 subunit E [Chrysothrix sp. TS-e1954]